MPAPEPFSAVAYGVIAIVPILILVWYYFMFAELGREGITGRLSGGT